MEIINRFKVFSFLLIAAYLLAACGGTLPQTTSSVKGPKVEANTVVAFTGIVEAINSTEWTVNGQKIALDPQASLDPNIAVGDEIKVEAYVSADGTVTALKIESSVNDDVVSTPSADANASSTPDPMSTTSPDTSETPDVNSSPDASQAGDADENEVFGRVDAITADTITVDGVIYNLADFTEFKDTLAVGDQVKLHITVNADGSFTVREVEKSADSLDDNNGNSGGFDDDSNDNSDDDSDDQGDDDSNDDDESGSGSGNSNSDDD